MKKLTQLQFNVMMPSSHNFLVSSNLTNFFAIGDFMNQEDFYAIGWYKKDGSFVIDTKVYTSDGKLLFSLKNMKVTLEGENFQQLNTVDDAKRDFHSVEVIDKSGVKILYTERVKRKIPTTLGRIIETIVTEIYGDFYSKTSRLVAKGTKNGLILHNVKAVMGATKTGSLGIVIGCSDDERAFIREFVKKHLNQPKR